MAELTILGAANAIPTRAGDASHFAISAGGRTILVDCGSDPYLRLEEAGLDFNAVLDLILTHFHPDHVGGLPQFLMTIWLLGRTAPLTIHGLAYTLDRAEQMMGLFGWENWPNFFPVHFHRLPEEDLTPVLELPELRIYASPVQHILPNIGLRVEFKESGQVMAYSCDTEPCPAVARLAREVDLLLHEATGLYEGHSSASQAGQMAQRAEAQALCLIHYPTGKFAGGDLIAEAREFFPGPIFLAQAMLKIRF